jgi:hypothetical protein
MTTHNLHQKLYLASVYFFLHFQYNGWFFLVCMGLLCRQLEKFDIPAGKLKNIYLLFSLPVLPAYFLSVLWWSFPIWLYVIVVMAAICQIAGWALLLKIIQLRVTEIKKALPPLSRFLFVLCAIAFTVKIFLQAGSVVPALSKLAFGFRPIVIGYLHLVLLGVISLFIISYSFTYKLFQINKPTFAGILIFVVGIFLNEILLMVQGVLDIGYEEFPFGNQLLFGAAILLFIGITIINYGQILSKDDPDHKRFGFVH